MKKLFFNVSLVSVLFISASWNTPASAEEKVVDDNEFCAGVAWEAANQICASLITGCTEEMLYDFTNTAYNVCMTTQQ